ncbi:MAG: STAS domain-containing protein [Bacillaceae bacterium]|nr:STAS domain-containing protein [Bacillaceae bacterium]
MNLTADVAKHGENYTLTLSGEIDVYTADVLKEKLLPLTREKGVHVIVDLEKVGYMDSTGLGVFISALKSSREHGSDMTLTRLPDHVYRLFDITGLKEIINIDQADEVECNG